MSKWEPCDSVRMALTSQQWLGVVDRVEGALGRIVGSQRVAGDDYLVSPPRCTWWKVYWNYSGVGYHLLIRVEPLSRADEGCTALRDAFPEFSIGPIKSRPGEIDLRGCYLAIYERRGKDWEPPRA
jgi:hypothetical protein